MRLYRGIYVAAGSSLAEALDKDQNVKANADAANKIFNETTERFKTLYGKDEDWKWFLAKSKA